MDAKLVVYIWAEVQLTYIVVYNTPTHATNMYIMTINRYVSTSI